MRPFMQIEELVNILCQPNRKRQHYPYLTLYFPECGHAFFLACDCFVESFSRYSISLLCHIPYIPSYYSTVSHTQTTFFACTDHYGQTCEDPFWLYFAGKVL